MKSVLIAVAVATILLSIQSESVEIPVNRKRESLTVTAAQIQTLQADCNNRKRFLIVDVRDKSETDVSIIPGAITREEFEKLQQKHHGKTVITYCTVGYRSEIYARKLREIGWNALNYQGSILDWCKHRLPVVTPSGQHTKRVHIYDSSFVLDAGYQPVY